MNCYEIEVRGVSFKVWAPTLQDAVETFLIDMDFYEVPKDVISADKCDTCETSKNLFPAACGGF